MLKVGIVGLPNVGKSTLFNALLKKQVAESANYPFTTIEPNIGVVEVTDDRLQKLAEVAKSEKIVPAIVQFVDIAGLVKGAASGEGLGNQFLSHIREVDAVAHVVREFDDPNVVRSESSVDAKNDIDTINTELVLADLETVEKLIFSVEKDVKTKVKGAEKRLFTLQKIRAGLESGKLAKDVEVGGELIKGLPLITLKPTIYVFNVSEDQLGRELEFVKDFQPSVIISAKVEAELAELDEGDQKDYLTTLGLKESGLESLIRESYKLLGLVTYFTAGEKETRAWTVKTGTKAPQAAGVIHTDFEKGFIKAEVINWEKLIEAGGWTQAREKGWVRLEGRDYVLRDGDTTIFKFNV